MTNSTIPAPGTEVRFREGFGEEGLSELIYTAEDFSGWNNTLTVPRQFVGLKIRLNGRWVRRLAYVTDLVPA